MATSQADMLTLVRAWMRGDTTTMRSLFTKLGEQAAHNGETAYSQELKRAGMFIPTVNELSISHYVDSNQTETTHTLIIPDQIRKQIDLVVLERDHADDLAQHGLNPVSKLLLTGKPGTGKTSVAILIARQLHVPLYTVRLDRLVESRLGKTLNNIGILFDQVKRQSCVLFLDEADSLLAARDGRDDVPEMRRATNLLLQELDRWDSQNVLIAASNMTELLDSAAFRRFDTHIRMPDTIGAYAQQLIMSRFIELHMQYEGDWSTVISHAMNLSPAIVLRCVDNLVRETILHQSNMIRLSILGERLHAESSSL